MSGGYIAENNLPFDVVRQHNSPFYEVTCQQCGEKERLSAAHRLPADIVVKKFTQKGWKTTGKMKKGIPSGFICEACHQERRISQSQPTQQKEIVSMNTVKLTAQISRSRPRTGYWTTRVSFNGADLEKAHIPIGFMSAEVTRERKIRLHFAPTTKYGSNDVKLSKSGNRYRIAKVGADFLELPAAHFNRLPVVFNLVEKKNDSYIFESAQTVSQIHEDANRIARAEAEPVRKREVVSRKVSDISALAPQEEKAPVSATIEDGKAIIDMLNEWLETVTTTGLQVKVVHEENRVKLVIEL